jgi:hypothetical protein
MSSDHAQLASVATALDDLIERVAATAEALQGPDEDTAADLYEVERSLRTGSRRLAAVLRRLDR